MVNVKELKCNASDSKSRNMFKEKNKIFYDIVENDNTNRIIIVSTDKGLLYANKLVRKEKSDLSKSIDEQYEDVAMGINKNIGRSISNIIYNAAKKNGYYKCDLEQPGGCRYYVEIEKINSNNFEGCFVIKYIYTCREKIIAEDLSGHKGILQGITENLKDLILMSDMNGNILYANKSACELLGYSSEEIISMREDEVLVIDDKFSVEVNVGVDGEKDRYLIQHFRCKDGRILDMEAILSSISNDDGKKKGYIMVARNAVYREKYKELKKRYLKMQEFDKFREMFFSNLSHEVRTPINIIYSSMQLLDSFKDSDEKTFLEYYSKYEPVMKQNCLRMLKMVNNLIDITKSESGFMEPNFNNHDIVKIVEDITRTVIPYAVVRNIEVIFDTNEEEWVIKCDKDMIERIVLNLLSNSIKYSNADGHIDVEVVVKEGFVFIRVRDNGIGIPDEIKEYAFDRFVQGDRSLSRKREGSGIGLSLVKSLVDLHKGEVYINPEVKIGTEVVVKIPNIFIRDLEVDVQIEVTGVDDKTLMELSDIY